MYNMCTTIFYFQKPRFWVLKPEARLEVRQEAGARTQE